MIITGLIAFLIIGLILGLIGGGGSLLGVPVLVYVMGVAPELATTYSLFIVGITALVGAISYLRKGEISAEAFISFAIASVISIFCMRKFIMPSIPSQFHFLGIEFEKHTFIMIVFAFIMKSLPAGLVLYIFVSTAVGILQQTIVYKMAD